MTGVQTCALPIFRVGSRLGLGVAPALAEADGATEPEADGSTEPEAVGSTEGVSVGGIVAVGVAVPSGG